MKTPQSESANSASVRSEIIRRQLSQLIDHLEGDVRRVNDARFRKLAMKSAEVLENLRTLFERLTAPEKPQRADRKQKSEARANDRNGSRPNSDKPKPGQKPTAAKTDSAANANGKGAGKNGKAATEATSAEGRKNARAPQPAAEPAPVSDVTAAPPPKPQDPDEIAAKARQQRLAARAPKRPAQSAPRPVPPQSGKPVWSRPHSS